MHIVALEPGDSRSLDPGKRLGSYVFNRHSRPLVGKELLKATNTFKLVRVAANQNLNVLVNLQERLHALSF